MGDPSDIGALTLAVGEIRGQLRELVHSSNNTATKVDGIAERVFAWGDLPATVAKLEKRIDALEADRDRRDGALGFGAAIVNSKPFGIIVTAVVSILGSIAAIKGGLFK
ncbi:hypothetical protein ACTJI5_09640 [Sphingopyxis sp. 22461]